MRGWGKSRGGKCGIGRGCGVVDWCRSLRFRCGGGLLLLGEVVGGDLLVG